MIEINPQEQPNAFRLAYKYGPANAENGFRRFNRLHIKYCNFYAAPDEFYKLRQYLKCNEINPKKQPDKYELERLYGFVAPTGSLPIDAKCGTVWNDIDAFLFSEAFWFQHESFYDLDKKYIW